jgi:hypothetical protein
MLLFTFKEARRINEDLYEKIIGIQMASLKVVEAKLSRDLNVSTSITDERRANDVSELFALESSVTVSRRVDRDTKIMIPVHVITKGEMLPWYGTAIISAGGYGQMLPGNLSGNIKFSHYNDGDRDGVCTGNYSNRSEKGWRTLNRLNINSTWYNGYLHAEFRIITKACHDLALLLVKGGSHE